MTLREYLDREPTGKAFIEVTCWLKGCTSEPSAVTLKNVICDTMVKHGGRAGGIMNSAFDYKVLRRKNR